MVVAVAARVMAVVVAIMVAMVIAMVVAMWKQCGRDGGAMVVCGDSNGSAAITLVI